VFVPRGVMHYYKNVGGTIGQFASFHFPSGFEDFFIDAGVECTDRNTAPDAPPDLPRMMELVKKHGMML
jgi:hypothetical protein